MTSTAPTPTERLEEILNGVIGWLAALDYPGIGAQMQRLTDVATALRQQAQPTREEGWLVEMLIDGKPFWWAIGLPHEENWTDDSLKALRYSRKDDAEAFIRDMGWTEVVATQHEWSDAIRALLPIDAPAREGGGEVREAVQSLITELGRWDRWVVGANQAEKTGANKVKAEVAARLIAILASPAEPAAHSLQTEPSAKLAWAIRAADGHLKRATMDYDSRDEIISVLLTEVRRAMLVAALAPASDAVKPGDET